MKHRQRFVQDQNRPTRRVFRQWKRRRWGGEKQIISSAGVIPLNHKESALLRAQRVARQRWFPFALTVYWHRRAACCPSQVDLNQHLPHFTPAQRAKCSMSPQIQTFEAFEYLPSAQSYRAATVIFNALHFVCVFLPRLANVPRTLVYFFKKRSQTTRYSHLVLSRALKLKEKQVCS